MSVAALPGGIYRFTFSGAITYSGGDVNSIEVGDAVGGEWVSPTSLTASGPDALDVNIGADGYPDWRILTQPPGISPALAVPESGSVS